MAYSLFDTVADLLFDRWTRWGPLEGVASIEGEHLRISLVNRGRRTMKFAAIEGRDANGKRCYPVTSLAVRAVLPVEQTAVASIALDELRAMDCQQLVMLDTQGTSWPISGFDSATL